MTKTEAAKKGWSFVVERPAKQLDLGEGNFTVVGGSFTAEKLVGSSRIEQAHESLEGLLVAIESWEADQSKFKPGRHPRESAPPIITGTVST